MSTPTKQSNTNPSGSSTPKPHDTNEKIFIFQGPPNKNATDNPTYANPEGILFLSCVIRYQNLNTLFFIFLFL